MKHTGWIVVWKSYGEWRSTTKIFPTAFEAMKHAVQVICTPDKDYNTCWQNIKIEYHDA